MALTIFVSLALVTLGTVSMAVASVVRARDVQSAADIARSTMSRLEAGLGTAQNLSGPVAPWDPASDGGGDSSAFSESIPVPTGWEVEIQTSPSSFEGLTLVEVSVTRRDPPGSDVIAASFTLRQLVRLGGVGEEGVAPEGLEALP